MNINVHVYYRRYIIHCIDLLEHVQESREQHTNVTALICFNRIVKLMVRLINCYSRQLIMCHKAKMDLVQHPISVHSPDIICLIYIKSEHQ